MTRTFRPAFSLPVLPADWLQAEQGANIGDPLTIADDLVLDDIYALTVRPAALRLSLVPDGDALQVAQDSPNGTPGANVCLDCCLTFMSPDGRTSEVLVLVELEDQNHLHRIFALPLTRLHPKISYRLVGIDTDTPRALLAQVACVSFTRGTSITLATGEQRLIEDLRIGDRVLTRDDGPQEIRWIGQSTTRAVGEFAPIRIAAGTLHNAGDLIVSPDHRLFLYQRSDELGVGRSEVLIRARHLVNGTTITQMEGGFVDYFQLLFDNHQIIYAEGIAAETLLLDDRTRPALPPEIAKSLSQRGTQHDTGLRDEFEVSEQQMAKPDMVSLLRRATAG
ncbi:Hint domain-containing protein [Thalassovita sp.]|uniref:Hint domain-containing protein n=1 Tax=Thalassovita sp. TaxID=1979401 RepID=UPI0029DE9005|nr:Hint domain-containing protein [Thalassovita sp.]